MQEIAPLQRVNKLKLTHDKTDIKAEEQKVICGALDLHRKTVREIMTKIRDVYMLSIDSSLDFDTINDIMQQGYSRVPVYEGDRTNIVSVLFIKDLAFIDPDDNTPLKTLCQFYQNPLNFVIEDTTLDVVMKDFKEGSKGHMAFVHKVNSEGDGDPFYEVVGVVTLEDVIEELIQEEIVDETDVFTDNRKRRRRQIMGRRDFTEFSQTGSQTNNKKVQISAQVQVAVFQYLRTTLEPFKEGQLSEAVVKRLIIQDIIQNIKVTNREESKSDPSTFIYTQGKPADYFVLIIEGYVEVVIGKEGLTFENGPFTYFGLAALPQVKGLVESPSIALHRSRGSIRSIQSLDTTKSSFVPDYSVRAVSDVLYLKISCSHYIAARRAFLLEQLQKEPCQETFEKELTKMLNEEVGEVSPLKDVKEVPHKETSALPNGTPVQAFNKDTSSDYIPTHPNLPNSVKKPKQMMETKLRELPTTVNTINVAAIDNDHSNSLENTLRENYEEESEDQTSTAL
ncbi:Metal transporter cnnm2 [Halocaridina rubra]|uniref:Metal transporter cnnm2 n=1 Tax=Halocaridina rubra TaxID=373956 RepID=A0AAN9FU86_HALRR